MVLFPNPENINREIQYIDVLCTRETLFYMYVVLRTKVRHHHWFTLETRDVAWGLTLFYIHKRRGWRDVRHGILWQTPWDCRRNTPHKGHLKDTVLHTQEEMAVEGIRIKHPISHIWIYSKQQSGIESVCQFATDRKERPHGRHCFTFHKRKGGGLVARAHGKWEYVVLEHTFIYCVLRIGKYECPQ